MKSNQIQVIGLTVETTGGMVLGKVCDVVLSIEDQTIIQYLVKPSGPLEKLISEPKLINRNQVIRISGEKMVVDDLIVGEKQPFMASAAMI